LARRQRPAGLRRAGRPTTLFFLAADIMPKLAPFAIVSYALLAVASFAKAAERYQYDETHMGMPVRITLYAGDQATANKAAEAAYRRFAELNGVLSDYDPQSELSRLSQTAGSGKWLAVSDDLWRVLAAAQSLSRQSDGAFDVTVGPLVKLWRRARRTHEMPSPERLAAAREAVGYRYLRLDDEHQRVQLLRPGMRLDLGGIAAGYAVDEALKLLKRHSVGSAMVDASGDIGVSAAPPGTDGWRIGVAPLEKPDGAASRTLLLVNQAVTTSGDAFQFVEIAGRRYSHIVDPRTGLGLSQRSSVTVVAPDCLTADSLATAASVLGPKAGLKLIADTPRAEAIMVVEEDGKLRTRESAGLRELEKAGLRGE
jgi:thiamine biosynthesis lipoprotein